MESTLSSTVSWTGQWLLSPACGGPRTAAPAAYFRNSFSAGGQIQKALLHITALGLYECTINGLRIGDHEFAPGWTDYRKRVYFQTYDVTQAIQKGENVIGVILGDGWYSGHLAEKDRQFYGERPQLLAQLEITGQDGSVSRISTGPEWKTTTGPILENDLVMGEAFDARRDLGDWSLPGYDAGAWQPAVVAPDPGIVIERSPGPPVRRCETLVPLSENRHGPHWIRDKARVYDLGQNITGRIRLRVTAARGTNLIIRYAEVLNPDGTMYTENLRSARATDYYTCAGSGEERWEPRFTFHGFRFVEIKGLKNEDLCEIEGIVLHSDTPPTGTFACSHPLLNQLQSNIRWGQKGNFLEVPTDCPQRDERLGWTGDAQVFIRTACFNMDVRGFFHKWLKDMRDAQCPDGAVPAVIPNTASFGLGGDGGSAWADAAFICPWTLYLCYGDTEILREHYDCMSGYMEYLAKNKVKDCIRSHPEVDGWGGFGDWLALDGSGRTEGGTAKDLIGTAHYDNNADIMAKSAELLGKKDDAIKYRALHGKIVDAFRRRFVTPDGLVAGVTQTAYVLALHFGLVPEGARATTARELVRKIEANGMHLGTGFVGTPYLLHVLEASGHLEVAYKLLEQETFPSWLFPLKNGATTIWERWDGWTPDKGFQSCGMNSFNHYAYGAVGDWMVSTVAGLQFDPQDPGYKHIIFKPRPGGTLAWAEARLKTPQGEAAIRWELKEGALELAFEVPAGARATVSLPEGWGGVPATFGPGSHRAIGRATK